MQQRPLNIWDMLQQSQLPQMNTPNPNYVSPYQMAQMLSDAGTSNVTQKGYGIQPMMPQ